MECMLWLIVAMNHIVIMGQCQLNDDSRKLIDSQAKFIDEKILGRSEHEV